MIASSGGGLRGGGSEFVAKTFILRDSNEETVLVTELGLILFEEELEEGSLCCPLLEGAGDSSECLLVLETLRVIGRRTWIFVADFWRLLVFPTIWTAATWLGLSFSTHLGET
ncbi:hypothetical protein PS029_18900 [Yersinia pestis]|nr:hypothetical protein [Yersinia pestis]